ncbi:uncharacterized protein C8R40DRAFT_195939 [Lentinula edodes]|uniref:uncharacterized protein n=1 Tax=Lentinula edodes TaxID=5353 RepID=UPI001E8E450C|nr:uncharacterized protein C8R40DRAFT_195939 [Lentinula edodes]KAH7875300.1 hypothetical protein C8R40DRAFT_195939 [Lentinula edodes]
MFKFALQTVFVLLFTQALFMGASATCTSDSDVPPAKFAVQDLLAILLDVEPLSPLGLGLDLRARFVELPL